MSRTITALFDSYADADAGRQRLLAANLDTDHVKIYDKSALGDTGSSQHEPAIWATNKNAFQPGEDRHVYEEGLRRGGFILIADVDDDEADEAVAALNESHLNSVDVGDRAHQWKSDGWTPAATGAGVPVLADQLNIDDDYRNHFQTNYSSAGGSYDDYAPAYAYGSQMRGDTRYSGRQWDTVESDLRTDWETRNTGTGSTWEKVKAAVRHGWDRMTDDKGRDRSY